MALSHKLLQVYNPIILPDSGKQGRSQPLTQGIGNVMIDL